jgi:hypothetical protein
LNVSGGRRRLIQRYAESVPSIAPINVQNEASANLESLLDWIAMNNLSPPEIPRIFDRPEFKNRYFLGTAHYHCVSGQYQRIFGKFHEKFAGRRWVIEFKYYSNAELTKMKTTIDKFTLQEADTEQIGGMQPG